MISLLNLFYNTAIYTVLLYKTNKIIIIIIYCLSDLLKVLVVLMPIEVINVLQPILTHCHAVCMDSNNGMPIGPYFPRRGHKVPTLSLKSNTRPIRPMVQMALTHNQLDLTKVRIIFKYMVSLTCNHNNIVNYFRAVILIMMQSYLHFMHHIMISLM